MKYKKENNRTNVDSKDELKYSKYMIKKDGDLVWVAKSLNYL